MIKTEVKLNMNIWNEDIELTISSEDESAISLADYIYFLVSRVIVHKQGN